MAGISTLGIGSSGVLSSDLIDKLRAADEAAQITPIEQNQESIKLKQRGLRSLKSLVNQLADLSTKLSDPTHYGITKASLNGDTISATVANSTKAQDFKIDVLNLATNSIKESERFASKDTAIGAGTMHLSIGDSSYDVEITADDTLETLSKKIEGATEGKIIGSVLNVGGDEPFRLILKSKDSGEKNKISATGDIRFYVAQKAKDAEFSVDGAHVKSASNEVKNLFDGIDITLKSTGVTTISVRPDNEQITQDMQNFVNQYNQITDMVHKLTSYDAEKKVGGVFMGTGEIQDVKDRLRDVLDSTFSKAGKMANDFGLEFDKKGKLSFDSSKFQEALQNDPEDFKSFFVGEGDQKGIFRKFNNTLFQLATKSSGPLKSLQSNLDERAQSLNEMLEKAKKNLNNRYDILKEKFASFDQMIGTIKNQSDYLSSMIDAQYAKK